MEQLRFLAAIILSFLVFVVWHYLFPYAPQNPPESEESLVIKKEEESFNFEKAEDRAEKQVVQESQRKNASIYTVQTPLYTAVLSEISGSFKSLSLKEYREGIEENSPEKELFYPESGLNLRLDTEAARIQGLKYALFTGPEEKDFKVNEKEESLSFSWLSPEGVLIEKIYTFKPESYLIGCEVRLHNKGQEIISDRLAFSLLSSLPEKRRIGFDGPTALIDGNIERIKVKSLKNKDLYKGSVRWLAMQDHYFATALIPENTENALIRFKSGSELLEANYCTDSIILAPGSITSKKVLIFAGPKSIDVLKDAGVGLQALVDFGWFDILAQPCLWLLKKIYSFIPNYGLAIIILTIFIKFLFWPLGNKSYRAMNGMKKLQPLMNELREKYAHDKQKMNQEIMNLYRTYKINPMSGCLPILVQMPFFIALYRMLYESIELRHAPFVGWIQDLSAPDRLLDFGFAIPFMQAPYGIPVLTIIMGASMFLQQKMAPPAGDPTQAKIMMFMPLIFTIIFINFPAGLVLYWLVNNILSIAQQYYITRTIK